MTAEEMQLAALEDEHIDMLSNCMLYGRLSAKEEVQNKVQPYWSFRDGVVLIGGSQWKKEQ